MTVKDLMRRLERLDPEMDVHVKSYDAVYPSAAKLLTGNGAAYLIAESSKRHFVRPVYSEVRPKCICGAEY